MQGRSKLAGRLATEHAGNGLATPGGLWLGFLAATGAAGARWIWDGIQIEVVWGEVHFTVPRGDICLGQQAAASHTPLSLQLLQQF